MTSMLLVLSLLIHLITLTAFYQLFKQVQTLKQDRSDDVTKLMETYLKEIKEENRLLETTLSQTETRVEPATKAAADKTDSSAYTPATDHVADESKLSLEAKVLQLYDRGLEIENIARQLNCGKTEAELIIKFNKKAHNNA